MCGGQFEASSVSDAQHRSFTTTNTLMTTLLSRLKTVQNIHETYLRDYTDDYNALRFQITTVPSRLPTECALSPRGAQ